MEILNEARHNGDPRGAVFGRYLKRVIGPREVGGRYFSAYWHEEYTVLAIKIDLIREKWSIKVATDAELSTGKSRTHGTTWDDMKDRVVRDALDNHDYRTEHANEIQQFWLEYAQGMKDADEQPSESDFGAMMISMHGINLCY